MPLAKATQKEIETMSRLYLEARERLLNIITSPDTGVGTKTYYNSILRNLTKELNAMRKASSTFIDSAIPREYRAGLKEIYDYFKITKLVMKEPQAFATIHTDALYEIAREMQFQIDSGLQTVGRRVMRYANIAYDDALRQAGLHQTGLKIASGGTISDMRAALIKEIDSKGFLTITYGGDPDDPEKPGRQVPIDVYSLMVARSTSREAGNTARLNQLAENGYDLVQMTEHRPTCEVCVRHQNRVYSISGADTRFPPLSMAFGQYNNIHPNCRHSVHPWIEDLKSPEEVQAAIEYSNRPFEDTRDKKERELYKSQQDEGRRLRNDLYQYERYKQVLGDDAPKSVQAFRRIKAKSGESWDKLQTEYRQARKVLREEV